MNKVQIPIGSKLGKWIILKEIINTGRRKYECQCICGTIRDVRVNTLGELRTNSCIKCSNMESYISKRIAIGSKFGKWLVLKQITNNLRGRYYQCQCICGIIRDISATKLRSNGTNSCIKCTSDNSDTGVKFGKWTVVDGNIKKIGTLDAITCQCDCGKIYIVNKLNLLNKRSKSCLSCAKKTHGISRTPLYLSWKGMMRRCYDIKRHNYHRYGGRGIIVCERWHNVENFIKDMLDKPKGYQLDRINNNANYEPGNCRWSTPKENANNRSNSKKRERIKRVSIEAINTTS